MLNNQTRKSLVETYKIFGNAQKVAEAFGVTRWTVYRLNEQFENTGSVELKTSARGRKTKLSEENLCQISNVILETPDITLQEIIDKLQLDCSISVLCRAIRNKLGFTRKKKVYTRPNEISRKFKKNVPNGQN
jgi:transposase